MSASGPATMYLVVRTIGTLRPVLWPLGYAVFLIALAAPYLLLAVAWTGLPDVARRVSAAMTRVSRLDLRRPIALALVVVGLALTLWAALPVVASARLIRPVEGAPGRRRISGSADRRGARCRSATATRSG